MRRAVYSVDGQRSPLMGHFVQDESIYSGQSLHDVRLCAAPPRPRRGRVAVGEHQLVLTPVRLSYESRGRSNWQAYSGYDDDWRRPPCGA